MVLGGSCPLISSVCKEPSGSTRIRRVRAASMRTLTCSRSGTSGPGMELFKAGLDSKRTACAKADAPSRSDAAATKNRNARRIRRPAYIAAFFANCGEANDVMHVQFCERSPVSHRHMRLPCFSTNTQSKRSEEHTSELQSRLHLVCRLLLEKKKNDPDAYFCEIGLTRCAHRE